MIECGARFISCEPLIGRLGDLSEHLSGIDQIIIGVKVALTSNTLKDI